MALTDPPGSEGLLSAVAVECQTVRPGLLGPAGCHSGRGCQRTVPLGDRRKLDCRTRDTGFTTKAGPHGAEAIWETGLGRPSKPGHHLNQGWYKHVHPIQHMALAQEVRAQVSPVPGGRFWEEELGHSRVDAGPRAAAAVHWEEQNM